MSLLHASFIFVAHVSNHCSTLGDNSSVVKTLASVDQVKYRSPEGSSIAIANFSYNVLPFYIGLFPFYKLLFHFRHAHFPISLPFCITTCVTFFFAWGSHHLYVSIYATWLRTMFDARIRVSARQRLVAQSWLLPKGACTHMLFVYTWRKLRLTWLHRRQITHGYMRYA